MSELDPALPARVAEVDWWHTMELAPGVVTPGADDTARRLGVIGLPADLSGLSVLDVGAWDGFFSFEAERRGARRVLAADHFAWQSTHGTGRAGFDLARETLGSRVADLDVDVMDLSPGAVGRWDVVLLLGVLYHLRHPLLALERVASVTASRLIVETHVDLLWTRRPAAAFYPGAEVRGDPSNWWGPNPEAVAAMLRDAGFREVRMLTPDSRLRRARHIAQRSGRYARRAMSARRRPTENVAQGRAVFHAWR